jgi:hypothetical protein
MFMSSGLVIDRRKNKMKYEIDKKLIGNLLLASGAVLLLFFSINYVNNYTTIPEILKGNQSMNLFQIKFWIFSIILFLIGLIVLNYSDIKKILEKEHITKELKNGAKKLFKLMMLLSAEIIAIVYTALLALAFFKESITWWFKFLLILTVLILFYLINEMKR